MSSTGGNGWNRYEERVLAELQALRGDLRQLEQTVHDVQTKEIGELRVKLAMLEVRSGLIGAIAGSIPAAIVVLVGLAGNS